MSEPLAYLNGQFLPVSALSIPVYDAGFVQGVTIAEQMRTFSGRLFRLDQHLARLRQSLRIVGIELPETDVQLEATARQLVEHNHRLLEPGDDLGLSLFVTPGPYAAFAPPEVTGPTIAMHTYPVSFASFAGKYDQGEKLVVTDVLQVPASCWPSELKCRSRMHYYLADRKAREIEPGARALLLDQQGRVTEASTANVFIYRQAEGFVSPPIEQILPGITLSALQERAADCGIPFLFRELRVSDVVSADEVLLCSTSPCVLPVVRVQQQPIGGGVPGPAYAQLLAAWNRSVGMDIREQAIRFAKRRAT